MPKVTDQQLSNQTKEEVLSDAGITADRLSAAAAFVASIQRSAEVLRGKQIKKIAAGILKPLWTLQGFRWDADVQRFIASNGRPVAIDVVKAASEMVLREAQYQMLQDGLKLQKDKLSVTEWNQNGKTLIVNAHAAETALGSGGWENTPESAWHTLGTDEGRGLPFHLDRWNKFGQDVVNGRYGETAEAPSFIQRVNAYADAMRVTYEGRKLANAIEDGHVQARRVKAAVDSCSDCVEWELLGWMPIEDMESQYAIGDSVCKMNCHCVIITRRTTERFVTDDDLEAKQLAATEGANG